MKIINFFKPTLLKIVLFLVIFIIFIFITNAIPKTGRQCNMKFDGEVSCIDTKTTGIGYPVFYGVRLAGDAGEVEFHPDLFLLNVFTLYLTSCLFIFVFYKIRNKED